MTINRVLLYELLALSVMLKECQNVKLEKIGQFFIWERSIVAQ